MKSNIKFSGLAVAVLFLAVFTACQPGNEKSNENQEPETTVQETEVTGPKTDTIVISQMKFQPDNLTINKGDTVVWINKDLVAHNVTEQAENGIQSDTIKTNASWKMAPDHSFKYICSIHPTMQAELTVNE